MRFNALGPDLPKARKPLLPGINALSTNTQAFLAALLVVLGALALRFIVLNAINGHFVAEKARLDRAQQNVVLINSLQTELGGYKAFAKAYGPLRDSGFSVARDLVKIGASWPNPRTTETSLQCLTPSDDGSYYTANGIGKNYESYTTAIHTINKSGLTAVPVTQSDKGARQEFTLKIQRAMNQ